MISVWHLVWIVPLAGSIGCVVAACCAAAGWAERDTEKQKEVENE